MIEKALYRKLIKRFHPDTTTCPKKKIVYEELTKKINHAFDSENYAELIAIDCQHTATFERDSTSPRPPTSKSSPPPPSSGSYSKPSKVVTFGVLAEIARTFIHFFLNPYGIALALNTWEQNGRWRNLLSLVGGFLWMTLVDFTWKQIDIFAQFHGISHESLSGLGIVSLKAILVLASLPTAFCLISFGFYIGVILGTCGVLCAIMMKVFGLFHPLLSWIPLIIYAVFAVRLIWHVLGNSFSLEKNS